MTGAPAQSTGGPLEGRTRWSRAPRAASARRRGALAGAGARVALVARDQAALAAVSQRLPGSVAAPCDLTDDAAVARAVDAVRGAFGDVPTSS